MNTPYPHKTSYYASLEDETKNWRERHPLLFTYIVDRKSQFDTSGEIEDFHSFLVEVSKLEGGQQLLDDCGFYLYKKERWKGKKKEEKQ